MECGEYILPSSFIAVETIYSLTYIYICMFICVYIKFSISYHILHDRTTRNPHAPERYTGGSSSGPAAIVASGLCSAALGTDGGGCTIYNASGL